MQNGDTDTQLLIERLRSEVRKRKSLLDASPLVPIERQPAQVLPASEPTFKAKPRLRHAKDGLDRAAIKNEVSHGWPRLLRVLRRNQGAVNEGLIKATGAVLETSEWLRENIIFLKLQLDEFHRRAEAERHFLAEFENKLLGHIRQSAAQEQRSDEQQRQIMSLQERLKEYHRLADKQLSNFEEHRDETIARLQGASQQQQQHERRVIEIEKFVQEQQKQTVEEHRQLQAQQNLLAEIQRASEQYQSTIAAEEKRSAQLETQLAKLTHRVGDLGLINDKVNAVRTSLDVLKTHVLKKKKARGRLLSQTSTRSLADDLKRHEADAFYLAFENQFRGDREEIRERLQVYVPFVKKAKARTKDASVIDVGCGRGEWLELLSENKYEARGVDTNLCMVEECRSRGLAVDCLDAIAYLRDLSPLTITAITGFHIVEHLTFSELYELFQETFRVLRKGGLAIFETPNPECIKVPTYSFYLDPTHRNPIPQELLCFAAKDAGFKRTQVKRLQPYFEEGVFKGYLDYAGIFTK